MEHEMKTKTTKTKPPRPHRDFADDIDIIIHGYGPRVRVVQLWRRLDPTRNEWTYIGRVPPELCDIEPIGNRFGGGEYRAKLLGEWDTDRPHAPGEGAVCGGTFRRAVRDGRIPDRPTTPKGRPRVRRGDLTRVADSPAPPYDPITDAQGIAQLRRKL